MMYGIRKFVLSHTNKFCEGIVCRRKNKLETSFLKTIDKLNIITIFVKKNKSRKI